MQPTLSRFIGILKHLIPLLCVEKNQVVMNQMMMTDDDEKQQSEEDCGESSVRLAQDCNNAEVDHKQPCNKDLYADPD